MKPARDGQSSIGKIAGELGRSVRNFQKGIKGEENTEIEKSKG